MSNISMDATRAANWVGRVREEITEVNKTLKEVGELTSTFPDQEDTVVQLIVKTGEKIKTAWESACDAYKNAWEKVEEGIGILAKAGGDVIDWFEVFGSKHAK